MRALGLQVSEGEVFAGSLGVVCLLLTLFNCWGTEFHVAQLTSNLTHILAMSWTSDPLVLAAQVLEV